MTGKSSGRPDKSGKNKISSVATPTRSNMFAQDGILATKHEILKENYETLVKDHKSLEESYKHVNEMNEIMKLHLQNQTKELEAKNQRLRKDLEKERSEMEEFKKEVKRIEGEKEAMINELRIKYQELLIAKKNEEEELKKMENKYGEFRERVGMAETEFSYLKSLHDAQSVTGLGSNDVAFKNEVDDHNVTIKKEVVVVDDRNVNNNTATDVIVISDESDAENDNPPRKSNRIPQFPVDIKQEQLFFTVVDDHNVAIKKEVIMVDDRKMNHTAADVIVISDESDAENDNPPRKSNITPQWPVDIKQEQLFFDGPSSSKVNHLLSSSSSSSSSSEDEYVFLQLPAKRCRDDYNKS